MLDIRGSVVTAMSLLTLYLSFDYFIPRGSNAESTYYTMIRMIIGSLSILVLGNMLLNNKINEQ